MSTTDLRLVKPFPALIKFAKESAKDLEHMNAEDHGHVPYLVLLVHYLEEWRKTHDGKYPTAYREKQEFREVVRSGMRTKNSEGGEENFEEAIANVLKNLNEPIATSAVREVFNAPECQAQLSKDSASFWIIARAIGDFYARNGVLPLPGAIPDMKAQSSEYVALQKVYKSKAKEDVQTILSWVRALEKDLNRKPPIPESEIEAFCKNAGFIKLIRGRSFQIYTPGLQGEFWGERAKFAANALTDETSLVLLYIAFMAYDKFYVVHGHAPGSESTDDGTALYNGAMMIVGELISAAGSRLSTDSEEYQGVLERVGRYCAEM